MIASVPGADTYVTRVYLSLPEKMTSRMALAPPSVLVEARKKWFAAFRECHQQTIRSLSYPLEEKMNQPQQQDFLDALEVIRSAGLPMPKSPSQQLIAVPQASGSKQHSQKEEEIEGEREERGFWSLRFHARRRGRKSASQ